MNRRQALLGALALACAPLAKAFGKEPLIERWLDRAPCRTLRITLHKATGDEEHTADAITMDRWTDRERREMELVVAGVIPPPQHWFGT